MILSRYFDLHVYETSKLFQVSKDFIFSVVTSYKTSWKSGITNLLGTNKRHEETNYCAFYDGKKFNYAKSGLKIFHFLYVRWWLQNVKCQTSNHVIDSSDQKLSVVPSLPKFRVSQTFIHILFLFYFVNTPFTVHYEKIRIHLREKANNFVNLHILAPKNDHLRVN